MPKIVLYDPTEKEPTQAIKVNPKLQDLRGKVVGFQIGWSSFEKFTDKVEELLREKYEVKDIVRVPARSGSGQSGRVGEEKRKWESFKADVDCAVLGLAT